MNWLLGASGKRMVKWLKAGGRDKNGLLMPSVETFMGVSGRLAIPVSILVVYLMFRFMDTGMACFFLLFIPLVGYFLIAGFVWAILTILLFSAMAIRYYPHILFPALVVSGGFSFLAFQFIQSDKGLVFLFGLFGCSVLVAGLWFVAERFRWPEKPAESEIERN